MNNIAVLGLGVTGNSVLKYLHDTGSVNVKAFNKSSISYQDFESSYPNFELYIGDFSTYAEDILSSDTIVLSPGINPNIELIKDAQDRGINITSDIEIFCEKVDKPILAITGTNGKSTVTKLCGHILQSHDISVSVGGNYGIPALELMKDEPDVYILELSSFQIDLLKEKKYFFAAVILNITPDHLDRYGSFENYRGSKIRLLSMSSKKVIDVSKDYSRYLPNDKYIKYNSDKLVIEERDYTGIAQRATSLNKDNFLASVALCSTICDMSDEILLESLSSFKGLSHRCELVSDYLDRDWVNDSKATNPEASLAAIASLSTSGKKIHIILGGITKGADLTLLCDEVVSKCESVILIGTAEKGFYNLLVDRIKCYIAYDMDDAVLAAKEVSNEQDIILLSPAAASFDMFKNFEDRGNSFVRSIQDLSIRDSQKNEPKRTEYI